MSKKPQDPDLFSCPLNLNPLAAPFRSFACRKKQEWTQHLDKDPQTEDSQNPQPQNLRQFPEKNNGTLRVAKKTSLFQEQVVATFRYDQTTKNPIGVVVMFHGLNSRIGHGTHLAAALAAEGFITVGFDHRGFGHSKDHSNFLTVNFQNHMNDSKAFVNKMKQAFPNLPMFALGLSLGGLTSYTLIKQTNFFKGAVLMAPAIQRFHIIKNILEHFRNTTTSNNNARKYLGQLDPYRYQGAIPHPNYVSILMNRMQTEPISYNHIKVPFYVVQGGCDRLVDPRVGFNLVNTAASQNKNFYYDDAMWHNVWFDKNINTKIMPSVIKWLKVLV